MIILEGPDGSGKSTTIERLGFERMALKAVHGGLGGDTRHGWGGGMPTLACYARKVRDVQLMAGHKVGIDRFHLSEHVYGPLLRHQQLIDDQTMLILTHMLRDKQIPVIMCLPPFEVTLDIVQREGRTRPAYQTEDFLKRAYEGFQKLVPYATIVYDFTKDPLPGFVDHAIVRVNGD